MISGICGVKMSYKSKGCILTFCWYCLVVLVIACLQTMQGPQIRNLLAVLQIRFTCLTKSWWNIEDLPEGACVNE